MLDDTWEPRAVHPVGVDTEPVPLIETKSTRPSPASTEEGTVTEAVVPLPAPRPTARNATGMVGGGDRAGGQRRPEQCEERRQGDESDRVAAMESHGYLGCGVVRPLWRCDGPPGGGPSSLGVDATYGRSTTTLS